MRAVLLNVIFLTFIISCSAEKPFYLRSDSITDGHILIHNFKTEAVSGYYLIGRYDRELPGLFPVELQIQAHKDVIINPEAIILKKGNAALPALRPGEIWKSYRMHSLDDYPFVFRMVFERPALTIVPSPAWMQEHALSDTASPEQQRIRYENQAQQVDQEFTATTIRRYERRVITLLFPLPVPDHKTPYSIIDTSQKLPPVTFYFERHDTEPEYIAAKSEAVDRFLKERRRVYEQDLHDLFDEHEQLHDHAALKEK
jgi:hypothetical protein